MCGIFCYCGKLIPIADLFAHFDAIKYRGPEASEIRIMSTEIIFGFHRLAIMDTSIAGMQPMTRGDITVIANCDIYNWRELAREHQFEMKTACDTEILLHMYQKFGLAETVKQLDGHFALALYDKKDNRLWFARDPYGVRSMYIGTTAAGEIFVASELKAISKLCPTCTQFPPGMYVEVVDGKCVYQRYHTPMYNALYTDEATVLKNIRRLLPLAVYKRMHADREMGCLLSGGLDSGLVTAIVQKIFIERYKKYEKKNCDKAQPEEKAYTSIDKAMEELKESAGQWRDRTLGKQFREADGEVSQRGALSMLKTFSIGMPGSTDLRYARMVAEWIGSDHREVIIPPDDFIKAVDEIIGAIESYDVTTVRASVGNYLICTYVRAATKVRVLFNGDGADELFGSYKYLEFAPSDDEFAAENVKLMDNIHYFDVLRSDKCLAGNGIENRSPFLDRDLIAYCMQIAPGLKKADGKRMEKMILRKAFANTGLLPDEVLWRRKEAFSDGVSPADNSWHSILTKHFDTLITDEEFAAAQPQYVHNPPSTKEAMYYRRKFEEKYPGHAGVIPYKWMPNAKWFATPLTDPSARTLVPKDTPPTDAKV